MRGRALLAVPSLAAGLALPAAASGATVSFTCCSYSPTSTRIVPGDQVTWMGTFGDHPLVSDEGRWTTRTAANEPDDSFSEQFNAAGRFRFHCMLHGGPGGSGMSGIVTVTSNQPPVASISAPSSAASGESVTFDASASSDDHGIAGYAWDLDNNGSFETPGQIVNRAYTGPATATVRLRVTDDNADAVGAETATTSKSVTIAAPPATPPAGGGGTGGGAPPGGTPPGGGGSTGDPQPAPPGAGSTTPADSVKPTVKVTSSSRKPLSLRIGSSEAARATIRLKAGKLMLASRTLDFKAAGERAVTLKLTKAAKAKLKKSRKLKAKLTVVMTDTAGNAATVTKTVTLRG